MRRVGFTGTRAGMTEGQLRSLEDWLVAHPDVRWLHHGDCTGADSEAHDAARRVGARVAVHPPEESRHRAGRVGDEARGPRPYLARNRDIVDETDALLAAPRTSAEQRRSGTWATVRYARSIGRPVVYLWPDGTVADDRGEETA